jgi:septum formation protein
VSESLVTFAPLGRRAHRRLRPSGEPFDKAGAYGIQGRAARVRRAHRGQLHRVMGLPLYETANLSRNSASPS